MQWLLIIAGLLYLKSRSAAAPAQQQASVQPPAPMDGGNDFTHDLAPAAIAPVDRDALTIKTGYGYDPVPVVSKSDVAKGLFDPNGKPAGDPSSLWDWNGSDWVLKDTFLLDRTPVYEPSSAHTPVSTFTAVDVVAPAPQKVFIPQEALPVLPQVMIQPAPAPAPPQPIRTPIPRGDDGGSYRSRLPRDVY